LNKAETVGETHDTAAVGCRDRMLWPQMNSAPGDLPFEENMAHTFVLRIWLEETRQEARQATWRGQITHAISGRRRSVTQLRDFDDFIAAYLKDMDVDLGIRWRLGNWLHTNRRPQSSTIEESIAD
jgi:hypothetical protein